MPRGDFWLKIIDKLSAKQKICLLWVVKSEGSSPGREGFAMAVSGDGHFFGTIGGGIMEQKLVILAQQQLTKNELTTLFIEQHHDKHHARQQSGMICSGAQIVVITPILPQHKPILHSFVEAINKADRRAFFTLSSKGLKEDVAPKPPEILGLQSDRLGNWQYTCPLFRQPRIHIIGGGHTSLALSEIMAFLGFEPLIYDDRPNLNTMMQNKFGKCIKVINYESLAAIVQPAPEDFIAIMTVGYRTDKLALMQLLPLPVRYLGLLGSRAKIKTMHEEFIAEGGAQSDWARIHTPIGLDIKSETVQEIAVSIAAQIIAVKNKR